MFNKFESVLKNIPNLPGVYTFKSDSGNNILYIGKAKNLKKRISSYFSKSSRFDKKICSILDSSDKLEFFVTKTELEAMLLEAELIKSNQPKFNVLLKSGQPFLYILFTYPGRKLPELRITRNKKGKGSYFGPFLEKSDVRRVYNFLLKTFKIKLCARKIENGCLEYHLGRCAGNCKSNFDSKAYLERLELARLALEKGHKKFLQYLRGKVSSFNESLEFEKSREFQSYYLAFESVFDSMQISFSSKSFSTKDVWILDEFQERLFLFCEKNGILKQKLFFQVNSAQNYAECKEYINRYYIEHSAPSTILVNFEIEEEHLLEKFIKIWQKKEFNISIQRPQEGSLKSLIRLAELHVLQVVEKNKNLSPMLRKFLQLNDNPETIDCFDISQKQGMHMVGACVRFRNGYPEKNSFRRFKIKMVSGQDDYACLKEIVLRRYKDKTQIPDLVLIDGGKGQLNAVKDLLPDIQVISLAKKDEIVFSQNYLDGKKLNLKTQVGQTLTAIRDYAHHFAISYHRKISDVK